jgi:hypothetical protein
MPGSGNTTTFKIIGSGVVSTILPSNKENDTKKIMFAPEAPEVLFKDYGTGQLSNGTVKIDIDPIFAKNIFVEEKPPLKVFIQFEGDCNGVFVTNKSKNEFTVKELNNGKSNINFSWQIISNKADIKDASGKITSEYANVRFPEGPESINFPTPRTSKAETRK